MSKSNEKTLSESLQDLLLAAKENTELFRSIDINYGHAIFWLREAEKELSKFYLPNQCDTLHQIQKFLKDK